MSQNKQSVVSKTIIFYAYSHSGHSESFTLIHSVTISRYKLLRIISEHKGNWFSAPLSR